MKASAPLSRNFLFTGFLLVLLTSCGLPSSARLPEAPSQTLTGVGLDAEYFNNLQFSGPAVRQIDTLLDFSWGTVPPSIGMRSGPFSARWTGSLTPQFSGPHTLYLSVQGEARLWLDDQLILEPGKTTTTLELSATRPHVLRLEFRKTQPEASLKLEWSSKRQEREVIPQKYLTPVRLTAQWVAAQAIPLGQNLLLNPDFEAGTGGWTLSGNGTYRNSSPGQGDAGQAAQLSNFAWVQQNLPLTLIEGGTEYVLEGWGRSQAGAVCTIGLAWGTASGQTGRVTLRFDGDWQRKSASEIIPVESIWMAAYLTSDSGQCEFDNVSASLPEAAAIPPRTTDLLDAVNNPDFDRGIVPWQIFGTGGVQTQSPEGSPALVTGSWTWVQQDLDMSGVVEGRNYVLRAKVRSSTGTPCTVGLTAANSSEITVRRTLSFTRRDWQEKALTQNLPSDTIWASVYLASSSGECSFDDVHLDTPLTPDLPLVAPSGLSAQLDPNDRNRLRLRWNAVVGATSYEIQRRTATTAYSPLQTVNTLELSDTVEPEAFYAYRLRAVRGLGEPSSYVELRFTTPPSGVNGGAQAGTQGHFGPLFGWPVIPIHAALLPDGRVFSFGTRTNGRQGASVDYSLWNPARGNGPNSHILYRNTTGTDIFCSAQLVLANGSVLVVGGDVIRSDGSTTNTGNPDITIFNPLDDSLVRSPLQMMRGRWYATTTMLANGDVLITGGSDATGASSLIPEIYTGQGWRTLSAATAPFNNVQWYPRTFQAPDGSVFMAGPGPRMWTFNLAGNGGLIDRGIRDSASRGAGISVMYDIGKILVAGGGPQANLADAMVIDINGNAPVVTRTTSMLTGRHEANATVLPNGRVLVTGGINSTDRLQTAQAVYSADTWNPATGRWTQGASAARIRVYHSISLLMPDGTVLTGGGGAPGPQTNLNAEIYYPEYLFAKDGSGNLAARPQILEAPTALSYGQRFVVRTPHSAEIASVSFIALGSVTHSWDMNQRFVPLSIAGRGNEQLELTAPASGNIAPPGYYMLFLVDTSGVPSKAQIVRIG